MDTISQDLWQRQERLLQSDQNFQKALEERKSLPIYAFKNDVMDALYNNSVVVIRGNTGSGKTTQVSVIPQVKLGCNYFYSNLSVNRYASTFWTIIYVVRKAPSVLLL